MYPEMYLGCDLVLPPPCPAQYKISTLVPAESDGMFSHITHPYDYKVISYPPGDERTDPPDGSRLGREGLDVGPKMQEGDFSWPPCYFLLGIGGFQYLCGLVQVQRKKNSQL